MIKIHTSTTLETEVLAILLQIMFKYFGWMMEEGSPIEIFKSMQINCEARRFSKTASHAERDKTCSLDSRIAKYLQKRNSIYWNNFKYTPRKKYTDPEM